VSRATRKPTATREPTKTCKDCGRPVFTSEYRLYDGLCAQCADKPMVPKHDALADAGLAKFELLFEIEYLAKFKPLCPDGNLQALIMAALDEYLAKRKGGAKT